MIRFEGVSKYYGKFLAIDNLFLEIPVGTLYGCLGPNGAGKTTTIRILAGILRPTHGSVWINGINVHQEPQRAKRYCGYVPDRPFLYEKLTAVELMTFIGGVYNLSPEVISTRTQELFEQFEIGTWQHKQVSEYSLGMRQKLLIVAAFLHNPKVFIIDEPMAGLDPKSIGYLKVFLRERVQLGTTIFLSTHSLPIAEELCDRIGILSDGHLLAEGTLEELQTKASTSGQNLETLFFELTTKDNHTGSERQDNESR